MRSIGTRSHEIHLHLPGFSRDDRKAPDDAQHGRRFSAAPPTASPLDAIPRSTYFWRPYQEKRALPGLLGHLLRGCSRCRLARPSARAASMGKSPCRGSGIDARFPFGRPGTSPRDVRLGPRYVAALAATLRRGYTTIDRRSRGTLLHVGLRGFRLNVCYCHQDLHRRPLQPSSRPAFDATDAPAYSNGLAFKSSRAHLSHRFALVRRSTGPTLQRHPFSGPIDSAGESLHTP